MPDVNLPARTDLCRLNFYKYYDIDRLDDLRTVRRENHLVTPHCCGLRAPIQPCRTSNFLSFRPFVSFTPDTSSHIQSPWPHLFRTAQQHSSLLAGKNLFCVAASSRRNAAEIISAASAFLAVDSFVSLLSAKTESQTVALPPWIRTPKTPDWLKSLTR